MGDSQGSDGNGAARIVAVIPVYNRPQVVLEAIESVAAQTRPPDLLVIVDDGSTDATSKSVEGWIGTDHRSFPAQLVRQENKGAAIARNRGAQVSGSDYLAFLDSDDVWPPEYLEKLSAVLDASPDAVAVTADKLHVEYPSGESREQDVSWVSQDTTCRLVERGPCGTSNTLFRSRFFDKIGGFASWFGRHTGEDYHLMLRISLLGPWHHAAGIRVTYRHRYAEFKGEEPPLSHKHDGRRLVRAQSMHGFIHEEGGAQAVPAALWKKKLGRLWFSAGKEMKGLGDHAKARECFDRALEFQPWRIRARIQRFLLRRT
jgi:glycosyltransferase involved in cell wall biosynthesis